MHKIGLNIEVLTQKPQNLENHLFNLEDIDELIIIHDRVKKIMTNFINLTQFDKIPNSEQFQILEFSIFQKP